MSLSKNLIEHINRIAKTKKKRAELLELAENYKSQRLISDEEIVRALKDHTKKEKDK